jgi:hypothetical protein
MHSIGSSVDGGDLASLAPGVPAALSSSTNRAVNNFMSFMRQNVMPGGSGRRELDQEEQELRHVSSAAEGWAAGQAGAELFAGAACCASCGCGPACDRGAGGGVS